MFGIFEGIAEARERAQEQKTHNDASVMILHQKIEQGGSELIDWLTDYIIFDDNTKIEVEYDNDGTDYFYVYKKNGNNQTVPDTELFLSYVENDPNMALTARCLASTLTELTYMLRNEEIEF